MFCRTVLTFKKKKLIKTTYTFVCLFVLQSVLMIGIWPFYVVAPGAIKYTKAKNEPVDL